MRAPAALSAVALLVAVCSPLPAAAQDAKLDVKSTDTVRTILERQMGKRVSVVFCAVPAALARCHAVYCSA